MHAALILAGFASIGGNVAAVVFGAIAGLIGIFMFLVGTIWDDEKASS